MRMHVHFFADCLIKISLQLLEQVVIQVMFHLILIKLLKHASFISMYFKMWDIGHTPHT